ncbi:MAG: glycosyltransferase family 39 protein, partial [Bacteroidales bacterium]
MKPTEYNRWQLFLLIFIALLPIMILRDFTPDNELKYLSIADEAIENKNVFAFFNHGIAYADKPPLYLWIVMLGKLLFGKHIMFFLSLFSIIPALVTAAVMDKWVRNELPKEGAQSAVLLLFSSAFYLACSIVLRMDMLMTMFITLAIYTFYKMYKSNGAGSGKIALPIYIFMAIFTKGAVGFLVPIVSIVLFLWISGKLSELKKYLGWSTWAILGGLCTIWFAGVYLDGGPDYLNNLLFNQTINRAVDSFHHKEPFWYYAGTFWYAFAPWSLLIFTVILLGYIKGIVTRKLEK